MTQNNLGNALSTLGARESGTEKLEEAVAAYRAAHVPPRAVSIPRSFRASAIFLRLAP